MAVNVGEIMSRLVLDITSFQKNANKAKADLAGFAKDAQANFDAVSKGWTDANGKMRDASGKFSKGAKSDADAVAKHWRDANDKMRDEFGRFVKKGESLSSKFASIVRLDFESVVRAAASMASRSISVMGDFEASMKGVQAVTNANAADFERMRDAALQMGRDTKFSASEASGSLEVLARNGLKGADTLIKANEASLLLAASTGTELKTAADLATDAMAQFGFKAGDLNSVVNQIVQTTKESKFGVEDYYNALAQGGGVAGAVGVSFEEFNAALAGTASLFKSGSDAGTSLKTFLKSLPGISGPAKAEMEALGLEFYTAYGSMKPMAEIVQELQTKLGRLSEEQRTSAAATIFGSDAMRTALGLAKLSKEEFQKLQDAIKNNGDAQKDANIRMEGFNGAVKELSSAAENALITLGDTGLLKILEGLVDVTAAGIRWFSDLVRSAIDIGESFGKIISPLTDALGLLVSLKDVASVIAAPFQAVAVALRGIADAAKYLSTLTAEKAMMDLLSLMGWQSAVGAGGVKPPGFASGGTFSAPKSGALFVGHGNEAVTPLTGNISKDVAKFLQVVGVPFAADGAVLGSASGSAGAYLQGGSIGGPKPTVESSPGFNPAAWLIAQGSMAAYAREQQRAGAGGGPGMFDWLERLSGSMSSAAESLFNSVEPAVSDFFNQAFDEMAVVDFEKQIEQMTKAGEKWDAEFSKMVEGMRGGGTILEGAGTFDAQAAMAAQQEELAKMMASTIQAVPAAMQASAGQRRLGGNLLQQQLEVGKLLESGQIFNFEQMDLENTFANLGGTAGKVIKEWLDKNLNKFVGGSVQGMTNQSAMKELFDRLMGMSAKQQGLSMLDVQRARSGGLDEFRSGIADTMAETRLMFGDSRQVINDQVAASVRHIDATGRTTASMGALAMQADAAVAGIRGFGQSMMMASVAGLVDSGGVPGGAMGGRYGLGGAPAGGVTFNVTGSVVTENELFAKASRYMQTQARGGIGFGLA